jgi:hypothetical protein
MIDRQILAAWLFATVLTRVLVSLKYVAPAKGHRQLWHGVESNQGNDFRNPNSLFDSLQKRLIAIRHHPGPVAPVIQLVVNWIDDFCRLIPKHNQRTSHSRNVDWLPIAIQNQRWTLEIRW